jgi:hypothetical protein
MFGMMDIEKMDSSIAEPVLNGFKIQRDVDAVMQCSE